MQNISEHEYKFEIAYKYPNQTTTTPLPPPPTNDRPPTYLEEARVDFVDDL